MPRGKPLQAQAKLVIYVDPEKKVQLKAALAGRDLTLKSWFLEMVDSHLLADDLFVHANQMKAQKNKT